MNPQTVQEVRLILGPWCLMTLAVLVPLLKLLAPGMEADWPIGIAVFGFFGGAAVVTALSFRQALRASPATPLSCPGIARSRAWSVKMAVLLVAVICAGMIACLVQTVLGNIEWREFSANAIEPVLLLAIIVCSTGFWTLLTRSVVGGVVLTGAVQFVLYLLLVLFARAIDHLAPASPGAIRLSHEPEVHSALSWFVAGVGLSYAAVMLWLGRRRFAGMESQTHEVVSE